jgi:hypothetical protein
MRKCESAADVVPTTEMRNVKAVASTMEMASTMAMAAMTTAAMTTASAQRGAR